MKTVVHTEYGSPSLLHIAEVEKPTPKDDEVLVKIHAASLNAYDWHLLTADIFLVRFATGLFKPKSTQIGADISGVVEAVGKNVKQFNLGDKVCLVFCSPVNLLMPFLPAKSLDLGNGHAFNIYFC